MYEYEILDKTTGERDFIWGYSWTDAIKKAGLVELEAAGYISCLYSEYVD